RAAGAGEVGIEGRAPAVGVVPVAPSGVGLPELDQALRHRSAVLVEDAPRDDDALAKRLAAVLAREVVLAGADVIRPEDRRGELGGRGGERDRRLERRPLLRRAVRRIEERRLAVPMLAAIGGHLLASRSTARCSSDASARSLNLATRWVGVWGSASTNAT